MTRHYSDTLGIGKVAVIVSVVPSSVERAPVSQKKRALRNPYSVFDVMIGTVISGPTPNTLCFAGFRPLSNGSISGPTSS